MNKIITSLLLTASLLSPVAASAANIIDVDSWTQTTDRYISGQLESKLDEVATDPITNVLDQARRSLQEAGVKLHCARTLRARNVSANVKCGSSTSLVSIRPNR